MKKNLFKRCLFLVSIAIIAMIVVSIIIKYDVEGEKRLPFAISKILLVSTVDGHVVDDPNNIWNIGVTQVNDIFMYINKGIEGDTTIKEIKIESSPVGLNNFNLPFCGDFSTLKFSNLISFIVVSP